MPSKPTRLEVIAHTAQSPIDGSRRSGLPRLQETCYPCACRLNFSVRTTNSSSFVIWPKEHERDHDKTADPKRGAPTTPLGRQGSGGGRLEASGRGGPRDLSEPFTSGKEC
jgi:hypothetical protein